MAASRTGRRGLALDATSPDTKTRILDAAELLFMEHGYEATSLRQLTAAAGVNLAAVNYHLGSKEELFQAVLTRRLDPMNQERIRLLEALERDAGTKPPSCERVLFAMLAPAWERPPAYRLYIESAAGDERLEELAARIEAGLCEGSAYRYARALGQLGAVRAVRVRDGLRHYEARRIAHGQRAGSIKPIDLSADADWHAWFGVDAGETQDAPSQEWHGSAAR